LVSPINFKKIECEDFNRSQSLPSKKAFFHREESAMNTSSKGNFQSGLGWQLKGFDALFESQVDVFGNLHDHYLAPIQERLR